MEEEFERLVKPVSDYIKEKYNPHTTIKLTIYKYGKDKKNKTIEVNSDRELILKLKEMI